MRISINNPVANQHLSENHHAHRQFWVGDNSNAVLAATGCQPPLLWCRGQVLLDYIQNRRADHGAAEIIMEACASRFRPIILVSLMNLAGFFPDVV